MGFLSGLGKVLKVAAPIAASFIPGVGPIAGAAMGAGAKAANVGGKVLTGLMNSGTLDSIGRSAGAAASTTAHNRGTELDAMMEADRSEMLMGQQRREEESDLWQKMQAADYMASGGQLQKPVQSAFGTKDLGIGPKPISAGNKAMAATLQAQLQKRLANPMKARDYDSKMKPGTGENILNWLGPVASVGGQFMKGREAQQAAELAAQKENPGDFIRRLTSGTLDMGGYTPRIDGTRAPRPDEDTSWLVDGMPGTGQPTKPTFRF